MTGVAAQWCESAPLEYRTELEARWREQGRPLPECGKRHITLAYRIDTWSAENERRIDARTG